MSRKKTWASGREKGNSQILQKSVPAKDKPPTGADEKGTPPSPLTELPAPRFRPGKDGRGVELDQEMNLETVLALTRTFATEELDVIWHFMNQLAGSLPDVSSAADKLNRTVPILHGLRPLDEMEAMLDLQMIGVHNCIMECIRRAQDPHQTAEGAQVLLHRVAALAKTFTRLMEALQKYRGQGSQQKVTVEHVHIHQGGQAIVGAVNHGGPGGEGEMTVKTEAPPPAKERTRRQRRGQPGEPSRASWCGARTRRGTPCRAPAMQNGRCRLHGGKSTGPRTQAGLARMRQAKTKHGLFSREAIAFRGLVNQILQGARGYLRHLAETTG